MKAHRKKTVLMAQTSEALRFLYMSANIYGQYKTPEALRALLTVRSNFSPMKMHADIQNFPVY